MRHTVVNVEEGTRVVHWRNGYAWRVRYVKPHGLPVWREVAFPDNDGRPPQLPSQRAPSPPVPSVAIGGFVGDLLGLVLRKVAGSGTP